MQTEAHLKASAVSTLDIEQQEAYFLLLSFRMASEKALELLSKYRSALILREAGKMMLYRQAPGVAIVLERLIDRADWVAEERAGLALSKIAADFISREQRELLLDCFLAGVTQIRGPQGTLYTVTGQCEGDLLVSLHGVACRMRPEHCLRYEILNPRHEIPAEVFAFFA